MITDKAYSGADGGFGFISREGSLTHAAQLSELEAKVRDLYDTPELVDFLALERMDHVSGGTYPLHGLVGIHPRLFEAPEHALFVGVHEAVHAKLGDTAAAQGIDAAAPGIRAYFHDSLVPAWLRGEVSLRDSFTYLSDKGYDGLVPGGWAGPAALTPEVTRGTVANYFAMAARGLVWPDRFSGFTHPMMSFPSSWEKAISSPVDTPEALAQRDPQALADVVINGFELGAKLRDYKLSDTMFMWEEGVANLIAQDLTGLTLEDAQKHMFQDHEKIRVARKLASAGINGRELAERVNSYEDLEAVVKEFNR